VARLRSSPARIGIWEVGVAGASFDVAGIPRVQVVGPCWLTSSGIDATVPCVPISKHFNGIGHAFLGQWIGHHPDSSWSSSDHVGPNNFAEN
jgi:hypothetical protein